VSVVITCCNQAHALAAAVRSAVAHSARLQIIVVDEGSTDGTAAVARRLDVLFLREPNGGIAAAKNRGLAAATGEFVIFLDAADKLLAGGIDIGIRALTSLPGCAMAYGRAMTAGPDGTPLPMPDMPMVRTGHHAAFLQTNLIWMSAMAIFRRDAVQHVGGFVEGLDGAADYDLYLRISRAAPIFDHGCRVALCGAARAAANGEAARLLHDTLAVMRRNCPDPQTPLHSAWCEGYARWQEIYGTQLVDEIHAGLRDRAFADAWRKSLALLSLAPWLLPRALRGSVAMADQRVEKSSAPAPPSANEPSSRMCASASANRIASS
jgi:hypothetical protein